MIEPKIFHAGKIDPHHSNLLLLPPNPLDRTKTVFSVQAIHEVINLYVLTTPIPERDQISLFAEKLSEILLAQGVKRYTVFGVGLGANLAQALAVRTSKVVRRMVLLDATCRRTPGIFTRAIDFIEDFLPLGLPLRALSNNFDSRPLLHRIYCPSLILISATASDYVKQQSEFIAKKIPNAWLKILEQDPFKQQHVLSDELRILLLNFLQVPTKRPQK